MNEHKLEDNLMCCILMKHELINELYVDLDVFEKPITKKMILFFKKFYEMHKNLDFELMINSIKDKHSQEVFLEYCTNIMALEPSPSVFYQYQEQLISQYKDRKILEEIDNFKSNKISNEELLENINTIQNKILITEHKNKVTPDEMIDIVRNKEKIIIFPRFWSLNEKLKIKKKTVNVIGARPSEGKSALALNLFCDLAKDYKCLYFNMEMTEAEVYERMLGIESNLQIKIYRA